MFHLVGPCEVIEVEVKESLAAAVDSCVRRSLNLSEICEVTTSQEQMNSEIPESDKFDHIYQREMHKNLVTSDVIIHKNGISILPNTEEMNVHDNGGDRILCPNSPKKCVGNPHNNVTAPNPQPRRSLRVAVPRLDMAALKRSHKRNRTIAVDRKLKEGFKTRHHVIASTNHHVQKKEELLQRDASPKAVSPHSYVSESIFSSGPSENLANFDSHPVLAFDYQSHDNVNLDYESHDITRKVFLTLIPLTLVAYPLLLFSSFLFCSLSLFPLSVSAQFLLSFSKIGVAFQALLIQWLKKMCLVLCSFVQHYVCISSVCV